MWLIRAKLAMWLDKQMDRIARLAEFVSPDDTGWAKWDEYARRRGYYDWFMKDRSQ